MKKTHILTTALTAMSIGALFMSGASAATVSPTDPVPNTAGPPADGGVGYKWTVSMGAKDSASIDGTVGAWSWDEDTFPETKKGWTHTSNWVALELAAASRVTIRIDRKAGVATPVTTNNPEGVGLLNLFPALTIYDGWDNDGGDAHNYNNRGNVEWAEDITYRTHVENLGTATFVEATFKLPAGKYSIALGGNSPSTLAEGRQGYGATLTTTSPEDPAEIKLRKRSFTSNKGTYLLKGAFENAGSADKLRIRHRGKTRSVKVTRGNWSVALRGLKEGSNVFFVSVVSKDGTVSAANRIVVTRSSSHDHSGHDHSH